MWRHPGVWATLSCLLAIGLVSPVLSFAFGADQSTHGLIGDTLLRGGVAYRDAWEHRPPGIFYVYWLSFLIFGRDYWSPRVAELLAVGLTSAGLVFLGSRRLGSVRAGVASALLYPLLYLRMRDNTLQSETFQCLCLIWAWVCWPLREEREGRMIRVAVSGILVSAAVLFKTPAILIGAVLLLDRWWADRHEPGWKEKVGPVLFAVASMASLPMLVMTYYAMRGCLAEVVDAWVYFPMEYSRRFLPATLGERCLRSFQWTGWLFPWPALFLTAGGVVWAAASWVREIRVWGTWLIAAWLVIVIQGKGFDYHHLPLGLVLCQGPGFLLVGKSGEGSPRSPGSRTLRTLALIALVPSVLYFYVEANGPLWLRTGKIEHFDVRSGEPSSELTHVGDGELAQWIRGHTRPEDRVFIWGDEPRLYLLSDRRMAGPYGHLLLICPPWSSPDHVRNLRERLLRERPRLIVISPLENWYTRKPAPQLLEETPDIREVVRGGYEMRQKLGPYEMWMRIE